MKRKKRKLRNNEINVNVIKDILFFQKLKLVIIKEYGFLYTNLFLNHI